MEHASALPLDDFTDDLVLGGAGSGLGQPISLGFLPDGRLLVVQKGGTIRIADASSGQSAEYLAITDIDAGGERGLLDVALDPNFAQNGYVYLYYTHASNQQARVSRFTHQEGSGGLTSTAALGSEVVLWEDMDGFPSCCHYGASLTVGPDGKLWLTTSDKFSASNPGEGAIGTDWPADLTSPTGKIIRINTDGTIPDGSDGWAANPFTSVEGDPEDVIPDAIWAYGLRNPFRASWDYETGYLYVGEVGGNQDGLSEDDLHLVSLDQPGAFYGWPFYEGTLSTSVYSSGLLDPADFPAADFDLADPENGDHYSAPIFSYARPASIVAGGVYRGEAYPDAWNGVFFYGDYTRNEIRYLILDETGTEVLSDHDFAPTADLPNHPSNIVFLSEGVDGAMYYIRYSAQGGEVRRIAYEGAQAPALSGVLVTDDDGAPDDLVGAPGVTFDFEATVSDGDTALTDLTYLVNFGDGTTAGGQVGADGFVRASWAYADEGYYTASLSVSDGTSTTFSAPITLTVGDPNDAPEIEGFTADTTFGQAGLVVTMTGTVTDPDDDALSTMLDWGDGTVTTVSLGPGGVFSAQHTYEAEGTFAAFVSASDGELETTDGPVTVQVGTPDGIGVTDGLVLALESTIKIGLDGDLVTGWLDGSQNGNNLVARGDPRYAYGATPSGLPAIVLDGEGDYLERVVGGDQSLEGFSLGSDARTVLWVVDYVDPNGTYAGLSYGTNWHGEAFGLVAARDGELTVQGWGGGYDDGAGVNGVPGSFASHAVVVQEGGAFEHYLDGSLIDAGAIAFDTLASRLVMGQEIGGAGEAEMAVAAAFVWNRALTPSELAQAEAYVAKTYLTDDGTPPHVPLDTEDDAYATRAGQVLSVSANDGLLSNDLGDASLEVVSVEGQALGGSVTLSGGTVTAQADGSFVFTPADGFVGTQSFHYTARSGDETETAHVDVAVTSLPEPGEVPVTDGLVVLLESDQNVVVGADGVTVAGWLDGSGQGTDLTASGDPRLAAGLTPSGMAAVRFDGQGDLLERAGAPNLSALPGGNAARTVFFVVDYHAVGNAYAGMAWGDGGNNEAFGLVVNGSRGQLTVQGWGGGNDFATGVPAIGDGDGSTGDDWFVHSAVYDGSVLRQYQDGVLIGTANHAFSTDLQRLVLGEEVSGRGFARMDVGALLIFDRALSGAERTSVETYLQERYLEGDEPGPIANAAPDAQDDAFVVDADAALMGDVTADNGAGPDADADGDALSVAAVNGQAAAVGAVLTLASGAVVTAQADGSFSYDPSGAFDGLVVGETATDGWTYTITDGQATDVASVTVTVHGTGDGGVPPDPPGVPPAADALVLSLTVGSGLTVNTSGTVTRWADQSGTGNHLTSWQGDPTLGRALTPSGLDALSLDGDDALLRLSALTDLPEGGADRTVFFVADYQGSNAWAGFAYGDGAVGEAFGTVARPGGNGQLVVQGWGNGRDLNTGQSAFDRGWVVQGAVYEDGVASAYLDGSLVAEAPLSLDTDAERISLGAEIAGFGHADVDVAAVLIYDRALTDAEVASVNAYLEATYLEPQMGA